MKISFIIPTLNSQKYIRKCIQSVQLQTLKDIEIIVVDAGSVDGTLSEVDKLTSEDKRIRVIYSKNKSYGYQINIGIDSAKGEYIGIVESDDYIENYMAEDLYYIAREKQLDFIKSDFWRFVGSGKTLCRIRYALTNYEGFYGRVIDISKEQECFRFVMNTWSGIYRKQFLVDNHIRHHESPGAAYQDNGFFFQTFLHAKRAYFINKAYYMNRRDNDDSSVSRRDKTYCICDEYKFIYDRIMETGNMELFAQSYAEAFFNAYMMNLRRIQSDEKEKFLGVFSRKLNNLMDAGILDIDQFPRYTINTCKKIMMEPDKYWSEDGSVEAKADDRIRASDRIIIYGAGQVGIRTLFRIVPYGKLKSVMCFAVTNSSGLPDELLGKEIRSIRYINPAPDTLVVVSVGKKLQQDVINTIKALGFYNYVISPETRAAENVV